MFERTIPTPASFSAGDKVRLSEAATGLMKTVYPWHGPVVVEDDDEARDLWRRFCWGTNYDTLGDGDGMSVHHRNDATRISFETAWSPAARVIREMSRQYPTLVFRLVWDGVSGEAGEATYQAGEGKSLEYPEGTGDRDRVCREYHGTRRALGLEDEEDSEEADNHE